MIYKLNGFLLVLLSRSAPAMEKRSGNSPKGIPSVDLEDSSESSAKALRECPTAELELEDFRKVTTKGPTTPVSKKQFQELKDYLINVVQWHTYAAENCLVTRKWAIDFLGKNDGK